MRRHLAIEAAAVALLLAGLVRAEADPYVVVSSPPSPTVGQTMGGYEYNLGGGIIVQLLDGAGNFVGSSTPLPITCEAGCSGGSGGGGGTVTQGPGGTNTSPWFVSPGTSTFPISGTVAVSGTTTVSIPSTVTISGTVAQGAAGTNTAPWFVSPGTSTFPVSGTVTGLPSGTQTVVLNSAIAVTQGPQGTNTSPWFVSPGTSTFPVSGTVAVSTATVGGSVSLTGTSTVVLNSNPTVNQGVQGTNTSPWFVSPGTSTFPVSGTVTAIPGAGTSTVLVATGTNTIGTVAVSGTVPITGVLTGTSTVAVANTPAVTISGTATTTEPNVNANPGAASTQDVNIQQIGAGTLGTGQVACGTVATVLIASRAVRQTVTFVNLSTNTVFIGGTAVTTAGGLPLLGSAASISVPSSAAFDCIASATSTLAYIETY